MKCLTGLVQTPVVDMVGQTIAGFTVLERAPTNDRGCAQWLCRHSCGGTVVLVGVALRSRPPKTCPSCAGRVPPPRIVCPYASELASLDELAGRSG